MMMVLTRTKHTWEGLGINNITPRLWNHGISCGIMESQNHLDWEKLLRLLSPTTNLALPNSSLNDIPK